MRMSSRYIYLDDIDRSSWTAALLLVYIPRARMAISAEKWARGLLQPLLEDHPHRVFKVSDLRAHLSGLKADAQVSKRLSFDEFIRRLIESGELHHITLEYEPEEGTSTSDYEPFVRYVWGDLDPFTLGLSLRPGSYISHGSAVFLHGLNDQLPKTIYVNKEQSAKPEKPVVLAQSGIDRAFANKPRTSRYSFAFNADLRFTLLSGKNTGRYEVEPMQDRHDSIVDTTSLERTLVDIAVRPAYAGGPHQVLEAYRSARDRASVNTVLAVLRKHNHAYPFHQAIGFYMERAGFPQERLERLRELGLSFDFYLANQLEEREYVPQWRLWIPKGL